jgi:hypothetical protein
MRGESAAPEESWPLALELRIDAACQAFEAAWLAAARGGARPRIEDYLAAGDDAGRWPVLRELLRLELHYRRGEGPSPEEYRRRFPAEAERLDSHFPTPAPPGAGSGTSGGEDTEVCGRTPRPDPDACAPGPERPLPAGERAAPADGALPRVGGYEVLGELGRGGMGVVYKARHAALGRPVAVKVLLDDADGGLDLRARFRREAEAVARLRHPNIVEIYTIGEQGGRPYFTMELAEGGNLAGRLAGKPWPARQAAELVEALARAVHHAHEHGLVHRDLKPANIVLDAAGTPKITDFGLVKHLGGPSGQTPSGAILGTAGYMAPEQAEGRPRAVGPAADVYALGALLYEALTGRPPFQGETVLDTILQLLSEDPVPPSRRHPGVPEDLEAVCLKCLRRAPSRRYRSALALAEDLRRFLRGQRPAARPWFRRAAGLAPVGVVAGAALALAAIPLALTVWHPTPSGPQTRSAGTGEGTPQNQPRLAPAAPGEGAAAPNPGTRPAEALPGAAGGGALQAAVAPAASPVRVLTVAFAGGDTLLSAGGDGRIHVWQADTGKELRQVRGFPADAGAAAVSPDGNVVAMAAEGQPTIQLSDAATGSSRPVGGQEEGISCLAFAPDGKTLASASPTGALGLWEVATGRSRRRFAPPRAAGQPAQPPAAVRCLVFSPDGTTLASATADGQVVLWDVSTGAVRDRLGGLAEKNAALAFSPDGKTLAAGGPGGTIRLWEVATASPCGLLDGQGSPVDRVAFSPDGRCLVSAGADRLIRLWDLRTAKEFGHFGPVPDPVVCLALSPDGTGLAFGMEAGPPEARRLTGLPLLASAAGAVEVKGLEARWAALADRDAARAYREIWSLVATPRETVPFLAGRLRPAAAADPGRIKGLIADLGDDRDEVRENARQQLATVGEAGAGELRKARGDPPPVRRPLTLSRLLEELLDDLEARRLQAARAIQVLELIRTPDARAVLEALARGAPGARDTEEAKAALDRWARRPSGSD